MKRTQSQKSLVEVWAEAQKRIRPESTSTESGEEVEIDLVEEAGSIVPSVEGDKSGQEESATSVAEQDIQSKGDCVSICCYNESKAYQPHEKATLSLFMKKDRRFLPVWYSKYSWITLCTSQKKVFCLYCRFAHKHKLLSFSKRGEDAFTFFGFDNYKKALEKFKNS